MHDGSGVKRLRDDVLFAFGRVLGARDSRVARVALPAGLLFLAFLMLLASTMVETFVLLVITVFLAATYTSFLAARYYRTFEEPVRENLRGIAALRNRRASSVSFSDPATAVLHRWYFEARLAEEVKHANRAGAPMSLLAFRVAAVGIEALADPWEDLVASVASASRRLVREGDLVASLGRSTYAMCLPDTDRRGAESVALRLADEFMNYAFAVGAAVYPIDARNGPALLKAALQELEGSAQPSAAA